MTSSPGMASGRKGRRISRGGGHGGRGKAGQRYLLEPLLLPRVEQYSHNNDLRDVDVVTDYLRRNYREYQRKQQGPFRNMVLRAIQIVHKKLGNGDSRERRLQQREERHIARRQSATKSGHSEEADELSFDEDEDEDGEDDEDDDENEEDAEDKGDEAEDRGPPKKKQKRASAAASESDEGEESISIRGLEESDLVVVRNEQGQGLNLLNSSLRTTYDKRPSLLVESGKGMTTPLKFVTQNIEAASIPTASTTLTPSRRKRQAMSEEGRTREGSVKGEDVTLTPVRGFTGGEGILKGDGDMNGVEFELRDAANSVVKTGSFGFSGERQADGISSKESPSPTFEKNVGVGEELVGNGSIIKASPLGPPGLGQLTIEENVPLTETVERRNRSLRSIGREREDKRSGRARALITPADKNAQRREKGFGGEDKAGAFAAHSVPRQVRFRDFGGIENILKEIWEVIECPLAHPEVYEWLGLDPPRGVLLHGPPGCGKTMLAHAIAVETGVPFLKISAPEVVSGMSGESEAKVRSLFAEAQRLAPCIVFIDEIDAITPKRETAQREMERRIVAQLLTCMDDLNDGVGSFRDTLGDDDETRQGRGHVVVIGATNRPDSLDPALRRAGRFDREIALGIPDENARARILEVMAKRLRLEGSFDFKQVARNTPGFVGADLQALTKEAAAIAVKRIFSNIVPLPVFPTTTAVRDSGQLEKEIKQVMKTGEKEEPQPLRGGAEDNMQEAIDSAKGLAAEAAGGERMNGEVNLTGGELRDESRSPKIHKEVARDGIGERERTDNEASDDDPRSYEARESESAVGEEDMWEVGRERWKRKWTKEEMEPLKITMADFQAAVGKVQPSSKREGFATIPDVTWEDVGALGDVREELEFSISRPIKQPEEYEAMGLDMAVGVLLYGPPGCGKTLVAKAIAADAGANFISIKGPELLNKYVGESERAVRQLFSRARASAPCVLFFDEMDAMAPRRGSDGNQAAERVVNQLLTEMDGLESRKSIFLIAATNRPDIIDPALLRPGRLDKLLYVPLPDASGRASIMRSLMRKIPLAADTQVEEVAHSERCRGFSGADLAALVREACIAALRERILQAPKKTEGDGKADPPLVHRQHLEIALQRVLPSVSTEDVRRYETMRNRLRRARGHLIMSEENVSSEAQLP